MKRFLSILCALSVLLPLCVIGVYAEPDAVPGMPETILGGGYTSKAVVDLGGTADTDYELQQGTGTATVTGGALDLNCDTQWAQAKILPRSGGQSATVSATGYDGILFWVDCSETQGSRVYVGCRISENWEDAWTRDTGDYQIGHDIVAYYETDGGWTDTHISYSGTPRTAGNTVSGNGERFELPAQYKGWIYIPFSSYVSGYNNASNVVQGLRSEIVKGLMILTGGYDRDETSATSMKFGGFSFVCLDKEIPPTVTGMAVTGTESIDLTTATVTYTEQTAGTSFTDGNGLHLVVNPGSGNPEAVILLADTYDLTGYSGIMFWMDGVNCRPQVESAWSNSSAVGLRMSSLTGGGQPYYWNRDENGGGTAGVDITAYYQDGDGWESTVPMANNNERFKINGRYAGWVYIPFSSYVARSGDSYTAFDPAGVELKRLTLLLQNYGGAGQSQRFFNLSNVTLVRLEEIDAGSVVISYKDDTEGDGKIDHLYINAATQYAGDDFETGIIFSDSADSCRFAADGGSPLFSRVCVKYDALLESGCYPEEAGQPVVISADRLGGDEGDKVIAVYWRDMPVSIGTVYARTFVRTGGETYYGEISSVALSDGGSSLPLAD